MAPQIKKSALVSVVTSVATSTITLVTLLVGTIAIASYEFGFDGRNGYSGRDGNNGSSGSDIVIHATGGFQTYNLSGGDASPGSYGEDGEDAGACRHGTPDYDLNGADGGDAGSGGDGGSGGSGGDVTIYTAALSNLQNVQIISEGGPGASGARGGRGGHPCRCHTRYWDKRVCREEKDQQGNPIQVCRDVRFTCHDGIWGSDGRDGSSGSNGSAGSLTVIPQLAPLPSRNPQVSVRLSSLVANPVHVTNHIWDHHGNAAGLLAPGSSLAYNYRQYVTTKEWALGVTWNARRSISELGGVAVTVTAGDSLGDHASLDIPDSLWTSSTVLDNDATRTVIIERALKASEATQLEVGEIRGLGSATELVLKDKASVSDLVNTTIQLRLQKDRLINNKELFEGVVPANALVVEQGLVVVKLGLLTSAEDLAELKKGNKIKVIATVTRSLASHSAALEINYKQKLK